MASIQKRTTKEGEVRYRALVRVTGHPNVSETFGLKSHAREWARETERSIQRGEYFREKIGEKRTLGDAIERYMADVAPDRRPSYEDRKRHLKWWESEIGDYQLSQIKPALIAEYRDKLRRGATHLGSKRSNACVNRYVTTLAHCLSVASREWAWLEENPCRNLSKLKEPRGRVRYLSDEERDKLLTECKTSDSKYLYPIVILAITTGMRKGEILNLMWVDVDLERRTIVLHQTKNGERRGVPIVEKAHEILCELSKIRRIDTNLLFPCRAHGGRAAKPIYIRTAFENAVKRAGIEDFRFHDLRHTAASYLAMSGATQREIMEVLGHKSPSMAARYSHLSESHTAKVLERAMDGLFD